MQSQQEMEADAAMISLLEVETYLRSHLQNHTEKIIGSLFDMLVELIRSGHGRLVKERLIRLKKSIRYSIHGAERFRG
jgi:hypothetical protein